MNNKISYKKIGIIVLAFILGIVSVLLFQNFSSLETTSFTTIGLIGFVLSIIIGGSSIVLAITTIFLGKSTESTMIEQNRKSIENQNNVYLKTIEALNRIESSTGVTEKRIEDIISGRVGAITQSLVDEKVIPEKYRELIINEINDALSGEPKKGLKRTISEKSTMIRDSHTAYVSFKDTTLLSLVNIEGSKTIKMSDGHIGSPGIDAVDGLFRINSIKYGISMFTEEYSSSISIVEVDTYIGLLMETVIDKVCDRVYLVFDVSKELKKKFETLFIAKDRENENSFVEKILIRAIDSDDIFEEIKSFGKEE